MLADAAARGCRVVRAADRMKADMTADAAVKALVKESKDTDALLFFREPRSFGLEAMGYLPQLAMHTPAGFRFTRIDIVDRAVNGFTLGMVGRVLDDAVTLARRGDVEGIKAAITRAPADGSVPGPTGEIVTYAIRPEPEVFVNPRIVVVHDFSDAARLPDMPLGSRLVAMTAEEGVKTPALNDMTGVMTLLAEVAPSAEVPVVVLTEAFTYSPDYVEMCLREFVLSRCRSVVTTALVYDPEREEFAFSRKGQEKEQFAALAARACLRYDDILRSVERYGSRSGVVIATGQSFVLRPSADADGELANEVASRPYFRSAAVFVSERQKGFIASTLSGWSGAARAAGLIAEAGLSVGEEELNTLTALRGKADTVLNETSFYANIVSLARKGRDDEAREAILELIGRSDLTNKLNKDGIIGLIDACKVLGLVDEFARFIGPHVPSFVKAQPELIIPLFEIIAIGLSPEELSSTMTACAAVALTDQATRPIHRIVDVCKRFCSPQILILLLNMIDRAGKGKLLSDARLAEVIGDALLGSGVQPFTTSSGKYDLAYFLERAPLKARILDALLNGRKEEFVRFVNMYFLERREVRDLILAIRTYTYEITQMKLKRGDIRYPAYAQESERIILSILFDDAPPLADFGLVEGGAGALSTDAQAIVAASYHGDLEPLGIGFRNWSAGIGVSNVPFGGSSIQEFFAGMSAGPDLPRAASTAARSPCC
ncbi:hypothetical protein [Methylobrevis pamukkalensis]|uniref:Uncharacterized protein n=1 Tax=Methylobrevis pamukkalensis TaxID=1439726 RepID=A0A1E3H3V8_9HYPH|nr:hypothetical protein [Methylobrevis pamukkalensis]ODN71008.1 hypothetical protein A6302_01642 [Methylobrevis pamukkalensis]